MTIEAGDFDQHVCFRGFTRSLSAKIESSKKLSEGVSTAETETVVFGSDASSGPSVEPAPSRSGLLRVDGKFGSPNIAGRTGDSAVITCEDVATFINDLKREFAAPTTACE